MVAVIDDTDHRHVALGCCLMPADTSAPNRLPLLLLSLCCACVRKSTACEVAGLRRRCRVHGTTQPRLGWSVQALWAGAEDVGVSAAAVGILPRGEAMLVEWHEHCCTAAVIRRLANEQPLLAEMPEAERIQVRQNHPPRPPLQWWAVRSPVQPGPAKSSSPKQRHCDLLSTSSHVCLNQSSRPRRGMMMMVDEGVSPVEQEHHTPSGRIPHPMQSATTPSPPTMKCGVGLCYSSVSSGRL